VVEITDCACADKRENAANPPACAAAPETAGAPARPTTVSQAPANTTAANTKGATHHRHNRRIP
jgi:hypothetical protein